MFDRGTGASALEQEIRLYFLAQPWCDHIGVLVGRTRRGLNVYIYE
jgi:hypothetical protein